MATLAVKKRRSRAKLDYTKPIIVVNRTNKHIYAQLLVDNGSKTVFTVSSSSLSGMTKTEKSQKVGEEVAKKLHSLHISQVQFNRNGRVYHGRIAAVADSIRNGGIHI